MMKVWKSLLRTHRVVHNDTDNNPYKTPSRCLNLAKGLNNVCKFN